ncbi:MAG TPA: hypothetical protein DDW50_03110 [Firmicutes bacterium]|jgi:hypothetical protein|nr:hypothetical protein [Bacillota bacterium]
MISRTKHTSKLSLRCHLENQFNEFPEPKDGSANLAYQPRDTNAPKEQFRFQKAATDAQDTNQHPIHSDYEEIEFVMDPDVKQALDNYQAAINRYNYADLSDPRVENVYFLERQISYISLQLALAKARIRNGMDPSLDYTSFESLLKWIGQCGE